MLCRLRAASKAHGDGTRRTRTRERTARAIPAPEANAELQSNLDVCLIFLFLLPTLSYMLMHFVETVKRMFSSCHMIGSFSAIE